MSYSLLQLVDQVSGELGLTQPPNVIGSAVNQTIQLLALAQRLGKDLVREFEWQQLTKAYIFQTTAATVTTGTLTAGSKIVTAVPVATSLILGSVVSGAGIPPYAQVVSIDTATQITIDQPATTAGTGVALTFALQDYTPPSDYDRMVSDTNWDRTNHWRNIGSKSSQDWQTLQSGLISTGPRERYRIYSGKLRIFPAVTTVYNLSFEYVSNKWVYNPAEIISAQVYATRAQYEVDTDLTIFPDDLMAAGLKYYFLKAKKLEFGVEMAEFSEILASRKAQDVPIPSMSLAPIPIHPLVGPWSVPDGSWPTS